MSEPRLKWILLVLLLPLVLGAQNSPFSSGTYFVTSLPINGVVAFDSTRVADTTVTSTLHIIGVNKSCFRVSVEDYNFVYEGSVEQDSVVVVTLPTGQGLPVMEQVYKRNAVISATVQGATTFIGYPILIPNYHRCVRRLSQVLGDRAKRYPTTSKPMFGSLEKQT